MTLRALLGALAFVLAVTALIGCGPPSAIEAGGGGGTGGADAPRKVVKKEAVKKFEEGVKAFYTNTLAAQKAFESAVDEDESFGEAWYNLGLLHEAAGREDDAVEAYTNAYESRPDLGPAYVNLGVIMLSRGKTEEAKALFLKVVDDKTGVEPFHVEGNLNLGMIYRTEGEEMVRAANKGSDVRISMEMGEVTEVKVEVPEDAKYRFADSVRHVRKALAGDSNNIESYENLAAIYYDLGSLEVATLVCQQAIQKHEERNKELGEMLTAGKITKAVHDRKLITDAAMAPVYNTYGLVWLSRGEVALAYHNFNQAMGMRPNFTEAMLNVAGIAVNVQDYHTAYQVYGEILKAEPDNDEARLSQAVAARGLGNLDEAEQVYRAMLQKNPEYCQARFNLAVLYQEYRRDLKIAKEIYEEFAAMPSAQAKAPLRVKEALARVQQIEDIWVASKKAEAEAKKMQDEMKKLEEMQKQQEEEYQKLLDEEAKQEAAAKAAAEGGAPAEGAPAEGAPAPEASP